MRRRRRSSFADAAWSTLEWDPGCFCLRRVDGPSYYDKLKAQLDLAAQRLILVPQGFIAADGDVQQFSVDDLDCNAGDAATCAVELDWPHGLPAGVHAPPAARQASGRKNSRIS